MYIKAFETLPYVGFTPQYNITVCHTIWEEGLHHNNYMACARASMGLFENKGVTGN